MGPILCLKTPSKWQHSSCIMVSFQLYAIRTFLGIESNVFVDISKSTFQKIKFDLSMDSYSHMQHSIVPPVIDPNAL